MKIQLLCISIFTILLIHACKQDPSSYCPSYSTNYQKLGLEIINQTPYFSDKAFDSIRFINDKSEIVTFVKWNVDTSWYCTNDYSNPNCPKNNANCYQIINNTYNTIKGNGNFGVKIEKMSTQGYPNNIRIKVNDLNFDLDIGWFDTSFGYEYYIGNVVLNSVKYENAIFAYSILGDTSSSSIILNKTFGLLKFNNKAQNTTLTLIKP
ncbi:MAG: hypothetical protein EBZ58_09655 [Bacteroidetes bacterium]|nr:hypothetical protein [Bacteroidota bacterium]